MLIVDAFNVVHAAPQVDPRLGGLTLDALARLIAESRHRSLPVLLIVDGTGGGKARRFDTAQTLVANVRAQFAGPGQDADSAIERLLDDHQHARTAHRITVVSSDKRLKAAAAAARAKWLSSKALVKQLIDDAVKTQTRIIDQTGGRPDAIARAGDEGLDPASTRYWLAQFGFGIAPPPAKAESGRPGPGQTVRNKAQNAHSAPPARSTPPISRTPSIDAPPTSTSRAPALHARTRAQHAQLLALIEQVWQEWGQRLDPDDLDMEKWLQGRGVPKHAGKAPGRGSGRRKK